MLVDGCARSWSWCLKVSSVLVLSRVIFLTPHMIGRRKIFSLELWWCWVWQESWYNCEAGHRPHCEAGHTYHIVKQVTRTTRHNCESANKRCGAAAHFDPKTCGAYQTYQEGREKFKYRKNIYLDIWQCRVFYSKLNVTTIKEAHKSVWWNYLSGTTCLKLPVWNDSYQSMELLA